MGPQVGQFSAKLTPAGIRGRSPGTEPRSVKKTISPSVTCKNKKQTKTYRHMKNRQKIGLLIAVVLAGAGAWSELKAVPPTTLVSKEIDFNTADFNTFAFMSENGDGTAFVLLNSLLDDGTIAAAFSFAAICFCLFLVFA